MSSHLSLASQTLPQSQSFCLAQDRMLQQACYEAVVCHGWIMAQFYHWRQSLCCDWRAKYKNEQVFLIAADKMILVLLAEWFCRCDLSLCPWFLSSLLSPGLAAYLIQTAFPVASAPFHYFIPNLLWWWDFTVAATALKDNQKWFRNAFTRLFPECQLKACVCGWHIGACWSTLGERALAEVGLCVCLWLPGCHCLPWDSDLACHNKPVPSLSSLWSSSFACQTVQEESAVLF